MPNLRGIKLELRLVRTATDVTHVAVRAVHEGVRSPLLSAEGCNFDDAVAEEEFNPHALHGVNACKRCLEPLMKESL